MTFNKMFRHHFHPAWMLSVGTILWLLQAADAVYSRLAGYSVAQGYIWQNFVFISFLNLFVAIWFGLMWSKVLRWRRRNNRRVSPEVRAERERIAQDLHDGVGSHLMCALALLDSSEPVIREIRRAIEHAMFALRVEMEALDDVDASLIERLASMRWRLAPLLSECRMHVEWDIPMEEYDASPRAEKGMQIALLAQEAMSNALQHSGGTRIHIRLRPAPLGHWTLEVTDNGCGIRNVGAMLDSFSKAQRGWGVEGMRVRAQRIGAQFELDTSGGVGTTVRVMVAADAASGRASQ